MTDTYCRVCNHLTAGEHGPNGCVYVFSMTKAGMGNVCPCSVAFAQGSLTVEELLREADSLLLSLSRLPMNPDLQRRALAWRDCYQSQTSLPPPAKPSTPRNAI